MCRGAGEGWGVTVLHVNSSPGSSRISIWRRREPQFAGKPKPFTLSWKLIWASHDRCGYFKQLQSSAMRKWVRFFQPHTLIYSIHGSKQGSLTSAKFVRYHPPSSTLSSSQWLALALLLLLNTPINRTFYDLIVPDYLLNRFKKSKYQRDSEMIVRSFFVKVGATSKFPGQPKINGRSQLRSHSLLNTFD